MWKAQGKRPRVLVAAVAALLATGGILAAMGSTVDSDLGNSGGTEDGTVQFLGRDRASGPFPRDFVPIELIAPHVTQSQRGPTGSTGSFISPCGTNAEGHRNSDNFMAAPGKRNGSQHVHDYVGNLSTDAFSTIESLAAAGTTCTNGDLSTYFWPVLRNTAASGSDARAGGGLNGNVGGILRPTAV